MATVNRQDERAPKTKRPLREVWKSTKLTPVEKVMLWLGWAPADITRHLSCTWCGKEFEYTGKVTDDAPRFCGDTHKRASTRERAKRQAPKEQVVPAPPEPKAEPEEKPKPKPKCHCKGHTGKVKQKYPTNAAAAIGMMKRHLKHADGRIYKCPTSDYWHITTQLTRRAA